MDAIVNPWNFNLIPRGLLLAGGVSGALKKKTGKEPWKQLAKHGHLTPNKAVITTGGNIDPLLIHVTCLTWYWGTNQDRIRAATESALHAAINHPNIHNIAIPLIGAGHGKQNPTDTFNTILDTIHAVNMVTPDTGLQVTIVCLV